MNIFVLSRSISVKCSLERPFLTFINCWQSFLRLNSTIVRPWLPTRWHNSYFYNISLNVVRPAFVNIYNLPFLRFPNIGKIGVKVGPKTSYFSSFMSSCTNTVAVFVNLFSMICSQPRDKQNRARDFLLFKYFWNNLLLTVFVQNTLSKFVELLQ